MKLVDAIKAARRPVSGAKPFPVHIICGFTPLHLQTFLVAHLQTCDPTRAVDVSSGLFGDCLGNLERLEAFLPVPEAAVLVLEWSDFDPRLGLRSAGGWRSSDLADISVTVTSQVHRFAAAIARVAARVPLRISLPSLTLPPISNLPSIRASSFGLELRSRMLELGARAMAFENVAVLDAQRLDELSPVAQRRDVAAELASGFPYSLGHASMLGRALAELVLPLAPKKGLITDLDDTLWRGLVGELGAQGVTWDLDHKSHAHALYQRLLVSLAESGVLLAVASKNDPAVVHETLAVREDLAPLREAFFPVEVSWGPKSEAVRRIAETWNVSAESLVFVDDSPLELAEVQAAWPGVTCLRYASDSDAQVLTLMVELRDLFGKPAVLPDDALRARSLRQSQEFREQAVAGAIDSDAFMSSLVAELTFTRAREPVEARMLELVNKTNQFNLNGRRFNEGEWLALLRTPGAFLVSVAYKDKFGPLGTIGVLAGNCLGSTLRVEVWVLSCRAFSRRIEHACLRWLFEFFGSTEISFEFGVTQKNGPLQEFLRPLCGGDLFTPVIVSRSRFDDACPPLYHRLKEPNE